MKSNSTVNLALLTIICLSLLVVTSLRMCTAINAVKDNDKNKANLIHALKDSLVRYVDTANQLHASITAFDNLSTDLFAELDSSKTLVAKLQKVVASNKDNLKTPGSSATVFNEKSESNTTAVDTSWKRAEAYFNQPSGDPDAHVVKHIELTHNYNYADQWIEYNATTSNDSLFLKLKTYSQYAIVLGYDKKRPYADITSTSPYSAIQTIRSYMVTAPKVVQKRWGVGAMAGVGIGTSLKVEPMIGVGLNYTFINF